MKSVIQKFYSERLQESAVNVFCKTVYGYLLAKILLSWPFLSILIQTHRYPSPKTLIGKIFFFPQSWLLMNIHVSLALISIFILASLFIRRNYFVATIIFWLSFNLFRLNLPVVNGSDMVLNILLVIAIPLSDHPKMRHELGGAIQVILRNASLYFGKIQLCIIYLVSGVDKLTDPRWRSGEAMKYIFDLDVTFNPFLLSIMPQSAVVLFILSWLTILFETLFPIFVWIRVTRRMALITGLIFHLIIWWMLNLPDFSIVMIVWYILFLTGKDFGAVLRYTQKFRKRMPGSTSVL